uniref:Ig-like domain-containing protein n=1 Tax=Neogobius melanostomus TaxID=47308 RepID=A0A8C6T6N7_9GOBI
MLTAVWCSVDPSVKLLLAPSEESGAQTLSCTAWGFNPNIQWLCGAQEVSSGSNESISLSSDGRVVRTSKLQVSLTDWKSGKVTVYNSSYSPVPGHVRAPALIHVETPSFQTVETASSEVSASCWVCTGFDATVSWWLDGKELQSSSVRQYRNSSHIISELKLPQTEWKKLRLVSCRAQHVCLQNTEKTVPVAGKSTAPASSPVVSIRRSLSDLLKGDSAVLECVIDNLSSSDFYVTFQSNGEDISSKDFVQLRDGSDLRSISTRFSVPRDHWSKDKRFSCRVNQGFSTPVNSIMLTAVWCSVDPSVKLLLAPSEESGAQTLSCTAWGFNPNIQWLCGAQEVSSGSNESISLSSDGRVVRTSKLQVSLTDWKSGKVFSCQVSDPSLNKRVKEDISVCTGNP